MQEIVIPPPPPIYEVEEERRHQRNTQTRFFFIRVFSLLLLCKDNFPFPFACTVVKDEEDSDILPLLRKLELGGRHLIKHAIDRQHNDAAAAASLSLRTTYASHASAKNTHTRAAATLRRGRTRLKHYPLHKNVIKR